MALGFLNIQWNKIYIWFFLIELGVYAVEKDETIEICRVNRGTQVIFDYLNKTSVFIQYRIE